MSLAIVPYAPRPNKRSRTMYDGDTQMVPANTSRAIINSYGTALGKYVPRTRKFLQPINTGYKKRKRKFTINTLINTRTNPVYPKPEVKYSDTILGAVTTPPATLPIPSIGIAPICLNDIGMGFDPRNRVGTQIASKSIYYQFVVNFGTATTAIAVRHLIYWDRQSNGQLPANLNDLLVNPAMGIVSPLNLTNRNRYYVLVDERLTMSPQGTNIQYCQGFRKINQLSTFEPSGANNFPFTGGLFMCLISDEPSSSTTTMPNYYGIWRFRYLDT